jgi:hypothetical protein
MLWLFGRDEAGKRTCTGDLKRRITAAQLLKSWHGTVNRRNLKRGAVVQQEIAELGLTDARGILQHGLEDRLQLARGTRNHAQYVRGRGLLLEGLAQLVEQARVLDSDDGLPREARDDIDVLVCE